MQRSSSETAAANGALAHVGQPAIADLGQGTTAARICLGRFADVRDALLREREWNFASAWVVPPLSPTAGRGVLTKRYALPEDCLGVRSVRGLGADAWAIEGASVDPGSDAGLLMVLVTSADAPSVNYTRRVEIPTLWDALFLDVFQLRLAAAIAPALARNTGLASELDARASARLGPAGRRDSRERAGQEISRDTSWLRGRGGLGRGYGGFTPADYRWPVG